ncbi:hypothetical protein [Pontibacter litorisediminis]|uniref:hypothetical protein n=1 Tax=Pontibacter litorisediminis TaxID=1846260 RepID=UPI0023EB084E|nr:hypothetical protein [Pontibacter litorisediminis]
MAENTELTPEQKRIAELEAQLKKEQEEKKELEELNTQQAEALSLADAQKGKALPVVQDSKKKKYQVLAAKFQHPQDADKEVKATDLLKDPKLVDLLVEKKSGLVKLVESK